MISTGDTAFVLKQHTSRTAPAPRFRRRLPGLPVPAQQSLLVAARPTSVCATACAHGPKGRR
jgi:hypothetical protein